MEVLYKNNKIERLCKNIVEGQKAFGSDAVRFYAMLSLIRNSDRLYDVSSNPPPRRHKLLGDYKDCFGIDINKKNRTRIVIKPIDCENIEDLRSIEKVEIVFIGDYHD